MKNKNLPLLPPNNAKKVLLHSCCAPCVCEIMETLKKNKIFFTVYFYNPNIDCELEYEKRKQENKQFAEKLCVPFVDGDYSFDKDRWKQYIKGYEGEPEKGKRCTLCFEFRLTEVARFASENSFTVFTSSLGISRWKNFEEVTMCGINAASKFPRLIYWDYNWRKKGGSERMAQIAKKENFYRQNYCGCEYSKRR